MGKKPTYEELEKRIHELEKIKSTSKNAEETSNIFKKALENSTDAIGMSTAEGKHYYQNKAFDELFGKVGEYPPNTLYTDKSVGDEVFQTIMAGHNWTGEVKMNSKEGEVLDIFLRAYANKDKDGNIISLVGVHNDITDRRKTEKALQISETRYRNFVQNATEGIYRIDFQPPVFLDQKDEELVKALTSSAYIGKVNDHLSHMYGLEPRDMIGKKAIQFAPDYGERAFQVVKAENYQVKDLGTEDIDSEGNRLHLIENFTGVVENKYLIHIWGMQRDITERKKAQEAFDAEKNFIDMAIDSLPGIFYLFNQEGKFLRWNKNMESVSGYTSDEIEKMLPLEFFIPEDHALVKERIQEVTDFGASDVEANWLSKDGTKRPYYFNGVRIDFKGIPCQVGMGIDISKRRNMENALRNSEEITRSIIDSSPAPIQLFDTDGYTIKVNAAHTAMFGSVPPPGYSILNDPIIKEAGFHKELLRVFQGEIVHFPDLYYNPNKISEKLPDNPVWSTGVGFPLFGSDGKVKNVVLMHQDITKRKLAEEALVQSNKELFQARSYLEAVIDNANVWMNVLDKNGDVVIWNKAAEQISGYSRDEVIGHGKIWELSYPDEKYRSEIFTKASQIINDGEELENFETTITTKNNESKIMSWHSRDITDENGDPIGSIAIGRDITETKHLEEQLAQAQKMESVGRLAGGVAHDFNNMLGVILGNVELAKTEVEESTIIAQELDEIETAALRSAKLTRQLLGFARKQTIKQKVLDLNEIISEMLKMLNRVIGENIDLIWKPGNDLWKVKVDPTQMDQIFTNLIVNARDAIDSHGKVTIETHNVEVDTEYANIAQELEPGEFVLFTISDNGHGIDNTNLENIFEPFFTTKPQGEGTGLGLSTVYGIVKQNRGFINVYSVQGHGSTFKIYLPRFYNTEEMQESPTINRELNLGTETVLIVEDEKAILSISKRILESLGYKVLAASRPHEALRIAKKNKNNIDLLITDVMMPEMNGRDLSDNISSINKNMLTLYMSGYSSDIISSNGMLDEGMQFIQKPFTVDQLSNKVRKVLEKN